MTVDQIIQVFAAAMFAGNMFWQKRLIDEITELKKAVVTLQIEVSVLKREPIR